jgi:hypothetical protein
MVRKSKKIIVEGIDMTYNIKRSIWITFKKEGIHSYPEAKTNIDLKNVAFLQHPHRHQFGFRVEIDVDHNEREIEFILFKRWVMSLYDEELLMFNNMSCESIGEELLNKIRERYPTRTIKIFIDEDGENGCYLESSSLD